MKFNEIKIAFLWIVIFVLPVIIVFFIPENEEKNYLNVYDIENDKIIVLDEDKYIIGVVAAEMPAEFEVEALKAQALAARTYLYSKYKCDNNPQCDICTDSSHCQAYKSKEDLKEKWGDKYNSYYNKISKAVYDTKGEIIVYKNEPISAVFHSTSSGRTENVQDVWVGDEPYLKSVDSEFDINSPKFYSEKTITIDDFLLKANCAYDEIKNSISIDYTDAGSVKELTVGNKTFKGNEIRNMFGLNSANFTMDIGENDIIFKVHGYGHGVGMSQYGANFMAKDGYNYEDIIKHYYTDVEIKKYK